MQETSVSKRNCGPSEPAGGLFLSFKSPWPVSSRLFLISLIHNGWVQSPVAIRPIPFLFAHSQILGTTISGETALAYLEWICKSVIIFISNLSQYYNLIRTEGRQSYLPAFPWL